jgi:hypothetical protein
MARTLVWSLAFVAALGAERLAAGDDPSRPHVSVAWAQQVFADYLATGHTPRPGVARIVAADDSGTSVGSGVLVDINATQGLVLTNWHVVRESKGPVLVQFPDGFQSAGTVLKQDPDWDLAVLVIWKPDAQPVAIAPASPVIGEPLTIAGYGRGHYREETGPCTQYLSPGSGLPMELVEVLATARQGDSGGPIFNASGVLAGVLFGQGDGRTVGSSASRVRMFLRSVGSSGFDESRFALASASRTAAGGMPPDVPPAATTPTAVIPATASPKPDDMGSDLVATILARVRESPEEAGRLALSGLGALSLVILALRGLFAKSQP